jgi:hypothetical protein
MHFAEFLAVAPIQRLTQPMVPVRRKVRYRGALVSVRPVRQGFSERVWLQKYTEQDKHRPWHMKQGPSPDFWNERTCFRRRPTEAV